MGQCHDGRNTGGVDHEQCFLQQEQKICMFCTRLFLKSLISLVVFIVTRQTVSVSWGLGFCLIKSSTVWAIVRISLMEFKWNQKPRPLGMRWSRIIMEMHRNRNSGVRSLFCPLLTWLYLQVLYCVDIHEFPYHYPFEWQSSGQSHLKGMSTKLSDCCLGARLAVKSYNPFLFSIPNLNL